MTFPELTAFAEECAVVDSTLAAVRAEDWSRRGLGEWSIAELTGHLIRVATRIRDLLPEPAVGPPACDRLSYFRFDIAAIAPEIAERARADIAGVDPADLPGRFSSGWRAAVEQAAALPPSRLMHTRRGPMRLDEYTATRVLEIVVHHIDLRRALDRPPQPAAAAGRVTMLLLEGLLGAPRPRNHGRIRFILTATGRLPSDDPRYPLIQ